MAPKPDPKIEEDKKHKLKSQSNGNAEGVGPRVDHSILLIV